MNKLWVRLGLAFAAVLLVTLLIAAFLVNRQIESGFRRYVRSSQVDATILPMLSQYYEQAGSWDGVDDVFASHGGASRGRRLGAPLSMLVDGNGTVLYDETGQASTTLSGLDLRQAIPISVDDDIVGYLYSVYSGETPLDQAATAFLVVVNQALLMGGVIAGLLALALGTLLARSLAAPLSRLATAARRISQGALSERVIVSGSEEMAEVAMAFNDMAAHLQTAEVLRRHLVSDIAHELRTPLTVIQGNLQAILEGVYSLDLAEIKTIYDETTMLSRLIEDLRELALAEAGQLPVHAEKVDLSNILHEALTALTDMAMTKGIRVELAGEDEVPMVYADPQRVRQILYNLLSNAIRYTPEGGMVTIVYHVDHHFLRVTVTDTGAGIEPDQIPYVFDRFWRSEPSRAREYGGSGLGLAIAKQLVEAQGGEIGVDSAPQQGSRFWFTLPILPAG